MHREERKQEQYAFIFREINGMWLCSNRNDIRLCLSDFLLQYGFVIPEYITYCIAQNDLYYLKYREFGATITCFIKDLSSGQFV